LRRKDFIESVERDSKRIEESRGRRNSPWRYLLTAGAIGWQVVIPALIGAYIGRKMDGLSGSRGYWTLSLMLGGLILGVVWLYLTSFRKGGNGGNDRS